mmetsp:Transcript_24668/g.97882  ORF Transcript_24668/g.97882 Transcript_24668/m.97882 type:complete len:360 (+) Transcript_24668:492-1571(+)
MIFRGRRSALLLIAEGLDDVDGDARVFFRRRRTSALLPRRLGRDDQRSEIGVVLLDVGQPIFDRVDLLHDAVRRREQRLEHGGPFGRDGRARAVGARRVGAAAAVGHGVAPRPRLAELGVVVPLGLGDHRIHGRAVVAGRVREEPRLGRIVALVAITVLEDVLADEVHLGRLVGVGALAEEVVQQEDDVVEGVAEDTGKRGEDVDARPSELVERDEIESHDAAARAVAHGPSTRQRDCDRDRFAARLDGVEPPQTDGDRLGVSLWVDRSLVLADDGVGDRQASSPRRLGRHPVRIQRVGVAARGEDVDAVAQNVAAEPRRHEAALEAAHEVGELVGATRPEPRREEPRAGERLVFHFLG